MSTPVRIVMTSTSYDGGSHKRGGHEWGGYDPIPCKTTMLPVRNKKCFASHYYIVKFEISIFYLSHCKLSGQTVIRVYPYPE